MKGGMVPAFVGLHLFGVGDLIILILYLEVSIINFFKDHINISLFLLSVLRQSHSLTLAGLEYRPSWP